MTVSANTKVDVVRVFTDAAGRFGNELGIARAADVAESAQQALATELGYSETVFVEDAVDGVARMRIYTPAVELPFAGHPSVGAAWWFATNKAPIRALEVPAGSVAVEYAGDLTWITARAAWTPDFTFHELSDVQELARLQPGDFAGGPHYLWAWTDKDGGALRSRMFAPTLGIAEDEATGAAAVAITALLQRNLTITQGEGSQLFTAWQSDGWIKLGGRVVADA
ncbi:PhzF family phenazine biosynthesis protein [Nocardia altamirensis]|uniref:PhzF family phenazine biosynthesis protein n=1 Tax=Nocardia altamirensis TaxID=472158 RepID=UPI0008404A4F|nr:PhzF family phenazine biosynthesis protein [Nocardia altamirensis]